MKKLIALLGMVGTALAGDLVLHTRTNPQEVSFESSPEWKYTLFHGTNLNDWANLGTTRGTGTNLTFQADEGFYKATKSYEPVEPLSANLTYSQSSNCASFAVTNFSQEAYEARVKYTEISNEFNLSYTTDSNFVQMIYPGINQVGNCLNFNQLKRMSNPTVLGKLELDVLYRQPE